MTDDIKLPPLPRLQVPRIEADVTLIDIKVLAEWCERIATDYARAAVLAEREALLAENEKLRKVLKDADNELDWLDETVDTCDHSVGVCMCDYWNVRRKMKAALSKRNDNEQ